MLQAFVAWNLSIDHQGEGSRGGRKIWRCLVKWEFYAVVTEELMSYVNIDEQKIASPEQNLIASLHRPGEIPTSFKRKIPMCMVYSMEESIARKVVGSNLHVDQNFWQHHIPAVLKGLNCQLSLSVMASVVFRLHISLNVNFYS